MSGGSGRRLSLLALLIGLSLSVSGCVTNTFSTTDKLNRSTNGLRIVLMPPDITLAELTAGGLPEPNAEWTRQGEENVNAALERFINGHNASLVPFRAPDEDPETAKLFTQLSKLHAAVGTSILLHQYETPLQLPTKRQSKEFKWSLGTETRKLKERFGSDYALFVHIEDSYASAGRVAVILVAAVFRVGLQGGQQLGFASLVDLNSGDIVWFNKLARASGDLRKPEPATESVNVLMSNFPS